MPIRIAKHKYTKKVKKPKQDYKDMSGIKFLDNVADNCAINGDLIANEYIFPYGITSWNPKFIEV